MIDRLLNSFDMNHKILIVQKQGRNRFSAKKKVVSVHRDELFCFRTSTVLQLLFKATSKRHWIGKRQKILISSALKELKAYKATTSIQ